MPASVVHDALLAAARRGVDVQLLIDGFGSGSRRPKFFDDLAAAGGEHCVFNPSYGRRYLLRNHQKLVTADERIAILGGANIDETYLSDTGRSIGATCGFGSKAPRSPWPSRYFDMLFRWSKRKKSKLRSLRRMIGEYSEWRGRAAVEVQRPLEPAQQLVAKHRPRPQERRDGST